MTVAQHKHKHTHTHTSAHLHSDALFPYSFLEALFLLCWLYSFFFFWLLVSVDARLLFMIFIISLKMYKTHHHPLFCACGFFFLKLSSHVTTS